MRSGHGKPTRPFKDTSKDSPNKPTRPFKDLSKLLPRHFQRSLQIPYKYSPN